MQSFAQIVVWSDGASHTYALPAHSRYAEEWTFQLHNGEITDCSRVIYVDDDHWRTDHPSSDDVPDYIREGVERQMMARGTFAF